MKRLSEKIPTTLANLLLMMTGEGIVKAIQLLINIAIARTISVESFGIFNNIFIITQTISIVSDFGMTIILVRDIANSTMSPTKTFESYFVFKVFISVVLTTTCLGIGYLADRQNINLYLILGLYNILQQGFLTFLYSLFRGQKDFKTETLSKILNVIGFLIGTVFFWIKRDRISAGLPYLFSVIIPSIYLLLLINLRLKPKLKIVNLGKHFRMIKRIIPTGIAQITNILPLNIPNIYCRLFLGDYETGIFSAAMKLILPLTMLSLIANNVFLPNISKKEALLSHRMRSILFFSSIIFIIFFEIFSPQIVTTVYGYKYQDVTPIFRILIFFPFIYFVNQFLGNKILSQKKDTLYTATAVIPVVSTFILYLFFYSNESVNLRLISFLPVITETASLIMRSGILAHLNQWKSKQKAD